jgi:hypothetical protein
MYNAHEIREIKRANDELLTVERLPLADRQEGREEYAHYLYEQPTYILGEIDHILSGNYGQGFYLKIWQYIEESPRMNHPAILGQWVAARCFQCSASFARQAWNRLSKADQDQITAGILECIEDAKEARDQ